MQLYNNYQEVKLINKQWCDLLLFLQHTVISVFIGLT